jgi:hypothetical protein
MKSSGRRGHERRPDRVIRIGKYVSGMSVVLISATAATAARGRTFFRSPAPSGLIRLAFDPNHRKDQNGSHAFTPDPIHA